MIRQEYDREKNLKIIYADDLSLIGVNHIKVDFKNIITNNVDYTNTISSYMWTSWHGAEMISDVLIYSDKGTLLKEFKWDVTEQGDIIEKTLWYYLLMRKDKNIPSNGLVIGTHDGRNGHWIYPVKENLTKATLIDGSLSQFIKLKENYSRYNNVDMINEIVTTNGGEVEWYQGGEGYTDTIVPDLINLWVDSSMISKTTRKSMSIKKLTEVKEYDWIHLDVEGIDDKLIMALEIRPNIIIFESMNLDESRIKIIEEWFVENSYRTITTLGNTLAVKTSFNI